jgi:hypothetical protein
MVQLPEEPFYRFTYQDGAPACFAEIQVWAQVAGGSGAAILVLGVRPMLQTDGSGLLLRIPRNPNWLNPEIRLIDRVAGRTAKFPLHAWHYELDWPRPAPFAEFDGRAFGDVDDYLSFLATRYDFLSTNRSSPLKLLLTRVGSPPPFPNAAVIFLQLQKALDRARHDSGQIDPDDPNVEHLMPGRRVLWALAGLIPVSARTSGRHTPDTLAEAYRQLLKRVAAQRAALPLASILRALSRALPEGLKKDDGVINELEDWALAGLAIFIAGLNAFGYLLANFDEQDNWAHVFSITMSQPAP